MTRPFRIVVTYEVGADSPAEAVTEFQDWVQRAHIIAVCMDPAGGMTAEECRQLSMLVEGWASNLADDIGDGNDRDDGEQMVDFGLKCADSLREGNLPLDHMEWRALEESLWYVVVDYDIVQGDDYAAIWELDGPTLRSAAAKLGLTREYFDTPGPKKGDG